MAAAVSCSMFTAYTWPAPGCPSGYCYGCLLESWLRHGAPRCQGGQNGGRLLFNITFLSFCFRTHLTFQDQGSYQAALVPATQHTGWKGGLSGAELEAAVDHDFYEGGARLACHGESGRQILAYNIILGIPVP